MAELAECALRDGYARPHDLPQGECIITSLPGCQVRIDHADPRILISGELLDIIVGGSSPHAWLDLAACSTYDGAVLRIEAVNRTVIYRITEYVPAVHCYIAEWPD